MEDQARIQSVFDLLGLGSSAERAKYKFEAFNNTNEKNTKVNEVLVCNTTFEKKVGAKA